MWLQHLKSWWPGTMKNGAVEKSSDEIHVYFLPGGRAIHSSLLP
jgi:hypothetical protein